MRTMIRKIGIVGICTALGVLMVTCGDDDTQSDACESNADCTGHPDGPACNTDTGQCVQCVTNTDCDGNPAGSVCDPATFTCVGGEECTGNSDCEGRVSAQLWSLLRST